MSATVVHARSTSDVVDAIRGATSDGYALRIAAGRTWMDAGRPLDGGGRVTRTLDLRALTGIIEYVPGDLTLTARAGTTLAEIDEATRPHGQWLPLDPHAEPGATIGATLATASHGTLAASSGLPRDLTIGVEFVDGRGMVVRGGGRVVKNVAGFDLVRLSIGAWGTLGVLTEVSVRLRARPTAECTLALELPRAPEELAPFLHALREAPITPLASEMVEAGIARTLDLDEVDVVLLRLTGNAASLEAQRSTISSLSRAREVDGAVWSRLRSALATDAWTLRLSARPSRLAALWHETTARALDLPGSWRQGAIERGVVRLAVPAAAAGALPGHLMRLAERWKVVGERLPATAWHALPPTGIDRLSTGVRSAFDPLQLLNPGLCASASHSSTPPVPEGAAAHE